MMLLRAALLAGLALVLSPTVEVVAASVAGNVAEVSRITDEEIVKEFKRYFKTYKDSATRVEAILALEGVESVEVASALLPVLRDDDPVVVDTAVRVLSGFESRPPVDWLLERLAKEKKQPIRIGLLRAVQAGGYSGAGEALSECLGDRDWEIRRYAVQALASGQEEGSDQLLLPLLADDEVAVRCATFEALSGLGSDAVRQPARAALGEENWRVRSAAIGALARVRHTDSVEPLIRQLALEEGRLREDVANALEALTGRAFGQREELWNKFWENYKDTYQIPTDEEMAELRAKQAENRAKYTPQGAVSYHGIDSPSRRIVFVIDVSGSMENLVLEKERFEGGDYPSMVRMDIVKTELARTVERLEAYVEFNILSFATEVKSWKKDMVAANPLNKSSAVSWIQRLQPIGGASKQDLASVGLVGAANLDAGKTNSYAALMTALDAEEGDRGGDDYEVDVDTIFFLSDGRPTHGRFVDPDDILREVTAANSLRRVVIHTIAIGEFQKRFMKELAEGSGGVFVDLGK